MPETVLDRLVVELGLDPTAFTEGQRKAEAALGRMRSVSQSNARDIETALSGLNIVLQRVFGGAETQAAKSLGAVQKNVRGLGETTHRTGRDMTVALDRTTTAMDSLLRGGLAVFAVVESIRGAAHKMGEALQGAVNTKFAAGFSGTPTQFLSAFGKAANIATGVPEQEAQAYVTQLRQDLEAMQKRGEISDRMRELMREGISVNPADPNAPQELLQQIEQRMQGRPQAEVAFLSGRFGMNPLLGNFLSAGPDAVAQQVQAQRAIAVTQAQAEAALKLEQSLRQAEAAFEALGRAIALRLGQDFKPATDAFSKMATAVSQNETAVWLLAKAGEALAVVFGVNVAAAIVKATIALNGFWATPLLRFLMKPGVAGPLAFLFGMSPGSAGAGEDENERRFRSLSPEDQQRAIRGELAPPPDTRTWWERHAPSWLGGKPRLMFPGASGQQGGDGPIGHSEGHVGRGGTTLSQMVALAKQAGFNDQEAPIMASIAMGESSGNLGAVGSAGEKGLTQINPHAWGQEMADFAASSPLASFQAAKKVYDQQGFHAWSVYNSGLYRQYLGAAMQPQAPQTATAAASRAAGITDLSQQAGIGDRYGRMDNVEGMIIHHTAGRGDVDDVLNVFRQRGVAANFVIDRNGNTFQVIPNGFQGRHIMAGWGQLGQGKSNANMEGVEIIAKDDSDVTEVQKRAAERLVALRAAMFGYDPKTSVFGHGEVNPGHRQESEGMKVVNAIRAGDLDRIRTGTAPGARQAQVLGGGFSLINSARAAEISNDNSRTHNQDIDVNLTVAAPSGNPYKWGSGVGAAIREELSRHQVNTGLTP